MSSRQAVFSRWVLVTWSAAIVAFGIIMLVHHTSPHSSNNISATQRRTYSQALLPPFVRTALPPLMDGACASEVNAVKTALGVKALSELHQRLVWVRWNVSDYGRYLWVGCVTPLDVGSACWELVYGSAGQRVLANRGQFVASSDPVTHGVPNTLMLAARWDALHDGDMRNGRALVMDVDADGGLFAMYAALNGLHVLALEPVPSLRAVLELTKCVNGKIFVDQVRVGGVGLSDRNETCRLRHHHHQDDACNYSNKPRHPSGETVLLKPMDMLASAPSPFVMIRIATVVAPHRVMSVLRGASHFLRESSHLSLHIVCVPKSQFRDIIVFLWSHNFVASLVYTDAVTGSEMTTNILRPSDMKLALSRHERFSATPKCVQLWAVHTEGGLLETFNHVSHLRAVVDDVCGRKCRHHTVPAEKSHTGGK
eukprot:PhM_4_TR7578/c0_g1_i1/m.20571